MTAVKSDRRRSKPTSPASPRRHQSARQGLRQRTLKTAISCTGVGLHSGAKVSMTLAPAPADSGIQFRRTDLKGSVNLIPARWDHVVDTRMCTTLGNDDSVTVSTVEHLMAALAGCGIDNALVELNGAEVPIMDGSAHPFIFLVDCAGVSEQGSAKRVLKVKKAITLDEGDRFAALVPADGFAVSFKIDFDNPAVARQAITLAIGDGTFKNEIARARTFGFMHEVEQLRAAGLARGGSLDNAIVVSGDKILNEGGLRYDNEFVRHKVLDAIGDLYLAGALIAGRFHGNCSGHGTNNRLLHALFADSEAWSFEACSPADLLAPTSTADLWEDRRALVAAPA